MGLPLLMDNYSFLSVQCTVHSAAENPISKQKKISVSLLCTIYLLTAEGKSEGLLRNLSIVFTISHINKLGLLVMTTVLQRCWESKVIAPCSTFSIIIIFFLRTRKKDSIMIILGTLISDTCKRHGNS